MLAQKIMTKEGFIEPLALAKIFHTTVEEVSIFTGVALTSLKKRDRAVSAKTQSKLQCVTEIISRITPWAGSEQLAYAWYRNEPIPAFGGLTAENLVVSGKTNKVRQYIEYMTTGGFA